MTTDLKDLRRIRFRGNWKVSASPRRDYLIRNVGEMLDEVAAGLAQALERAAGPGSRLGIATRVPNVPGSNRTLRLVETLKPLHSSKVDVCLVQRPPDLFVRTSLELHTWLAYLRFAFCGLLAWAVLLLGVWLYLGYSGAFGAIVDDAVRQLNPSAIEAPIAKRWGYTLGPNQEWVRSAPVNVAEVLRSNPRLAFSHLATPFAVLMGVTGLVVFVVQRIVFDPLCHLLGWPTPQELDDFASSNGAWVSATVSKVLGEFGVSEVDKHAS